MRKLLEDKNIDAISIATPNHWHTLHDHLGVPGRQGRLRREAVLAQHLRGASRLSPRPASTTAWCSRAARAARRRRCRKPCSRCATACSARSTWLAASATSGATPSAPTPVEPVPPSAWTTTCGRAPRRSVPFTENRFHYNWHWFWDYRQRRPRQPGHPRSRHRALGPGRDASHQGQRHRRQVHVRRRPGDAEHHQLRATSSTSNGKKKMMTFEVRHWMSPHEAGIDERQAGQHHRQPVLRLQGLPGHRQLQQVLLLPGQGAEARAHRRRSRTAATGRTSSTRCAAASART